MVKCMMKRFFWEIGNRIANCFLFKTFNKSKTKLRRKNLKAPVPHWPQQRLQVPVLSLVDGFTSVLFGRGVAVCFKNVYGTYSKFELYRKVFLKPLKFFLRFELLQSISYIFKTILMLCTSGIHKYRKKFI